MKKSEEGIIEMQEKRGNLRPAVLSLFREAQNIGILMQHNQKNYWRVHNYMMKNEPLLFG